MLDQLLHYARRLDDVEVAVELERVWDDRAAAQQVMDVNAAAAEAAAIAVDAEAVARQAAIQVTSGFDFEGRRIATYLGFTSSEVVLGMGVFRGIGADFANFFGVESESLGRKLTEAEAAAFGRLRRQVDEMGGNAIIGIDLDYTMFGASLVGVIASGTAVVLAEG